MSSSITPNLQIIPMPVIDLSKQGQISPARTVKQMESPISSGVNGFFLGGALVWLKDIVKAVANKTRYESSFRTFLIFSTLVGTGYGLMQKLKIDKAKAKQDANQDILIKNHFTGKETLITKNPLEQISSAINSSRNLITRKFESPLSYGMGGFGSSVIILGLIDFGLKKIGKGELASSTRGLLSLSALLGVVMGMAQKLRIDGAKANKNVDQDIIVRNHWTGNEEIIRTRRQMY